MTDRFDAAVEIVLAAEGVLSDDSRDPGGLTRYGISQRAYPDLAIAALTRADAVALYRRDYWERCGCGGLPWMLALPLFDGAVNQGPGLAIRLLQAALGLPADGTVGPRTLAAAAAAGVPVLDRYMTERILDYVHAEGWPVYGRGWVSRTLRVHRLALG